MKNLFDNIMTFSFLAGPGRDRLNIAGLVFSCSKKRCFTIHDSQKQIQCEKLFGNIMTVGFLAGPGRDRLSFFFEFIRNLEMYFLKITY